MAPCPRGPGPSSNDLWWLDVGGVAARGNARKEQGPLIRPDIDLAVRVRDPERDGIARRQLYISHTRLKPASDTKKPGRVQADMPWVL